jgi:hypothetical protein
VSLRVEVEEQDRDAWVATIRDDEYPYLIVSFEYEFAEGYLFRTGFSVRWDPDSSSSSEITLYEIRRDFPISSWEKAAQLEVVLLIEREQVESEREPHVEGSSSSETGVPRLLSIAVEYKKNISEGIPDPVAKIARNHGVKPETARSWVHRARSKGYLGPAEVGKAGVSPTRSKSGSKKGTGAKRQTRRRGSR